MATQQLTKEARRGVERLLAFSEHVGDIQEDDVLAVLREQGITTLESLIRHGLAAPRSAAPTSVAPVDPGAAPAASAPVSAPGTITHRPPGMAVLVDGVEHDPEDLTRFDGRPLHFVASRNGGGEPRLLAFTDDRPLRTALWVSSLLRDHNGAAPAQARAGAPFHRGTVQMFEHHHFEGDWFWLEAGFMWPDLTKVHHGPFWSRKDWNDTISSVSATDCNITFYEHTNQGGSSFFSPAFTGEPTGGHAWGELSPIGWNDRISCVVNWGVAH